MGRAAAPRRFPDETLDALFRHILDNDVVNEAASLPAAIPRRFTATQIADAYGLALDLFTRRLDVRVMRGILRDALTGGDIPAADRLPFKYARALFKQMRFARANFDRRHRYPRLFHVMTVAFGHLQDDVRNGRALRTRMRAALCLALMSPPFLRLARREVEAFRPETCEGLMAWMEREDRRLREAISRATVSGAVFHGVRKIVSRRVSLYDTLRTVAPGAEMDRVAAFLATVNGLMGAAHDRLVEARGRGEFDYHRDPFPFPPEIRDRIAAFLSARGEKQGGEKQGDETQGGEERN